MFQTKPFLGIVASMINRMRVRTTRVTDYSEGSVVRTMLEASAQELDELYQQMVAGLVAAVPVATYRSFGFTKQPATAAGGLVRVSITPQAAPVVIPAGSLLVQAVSSVVYASSLDVVIAAGNSYGDVPVVATTAGVATNLGVGVAFTVANVPAGFLSASNLVAFGNGRDLESDADQKTRFNDFIATLPRGTVRALQYGARDLSYLTDANGNIVERVARVSVHEPYVTDNTQPVGWVQVFVHNGTGSTSAGLVAQVVQVLYGYYDASGNPVAGFKAAGVRVDVAAATEQPVNVSATLSVGPGTVKADLVTAATNAINAYILGLDIGASCILAEITDLVMSLPGVTNWVYAAGQVDTASSYSAKLMPGAVAIA